MIDLDLITTYKAMDKKGFINVLQQYKKVIVNFKENGTEEEKELTDLIVAFLDLSVYLTKEKRSKKW